MNETCSGIELEQVGNTIVVIPTKDIGEFDFPQIQGEVDRILARLARSQVTNLVIDFQRTDYFGSSAMGLLINLRKRVTACHGQMALCGLSDHERELLRITHLDGLWKVYHSRQDALKAVRSQAA
jgi:anti-sigma B factor antagonist